MRYTDERYTIPSETNPFNTFQATLVNACITGQGTYGIPAETINALVGFQSKWKPAFDLCDNKSTNSPANRAARDQVMQEYGDLADTVMHDYFAGKPSVSAETKLALGVHTGKRTRTATVPPKTVPELHIDNTEPGAHHIRFRNADTEDAFGKPKGIIFCEIRYQTGGDAPVSPDTLTQDEKLSRTGQTISFTSADKGKTVWYFGRWINRKGQAGSWSKIASDIVR